MKAATIRSIVYWFEQELDSYEWTEDVYGQLRFLLVSSLVSGHPFQIVLRPKSTTDITKIKHILGNHPKYELTGLLINSLARAS